MAPPGDRGPAVVDEQLLNQARETLRANSLFDSAIQFWRGTSGHEYVHTLYTLKGCPAVPPACVMLVRRNPDNTPVVLSVLSVDHDCPSLNLAEIRQSGAQLGANEVHLHFAMGDKYARHTAVFDLRTQHGDIAVVGG